MPFNTSFYLQDSGGGQWQITIHSDGQLRSTPGGSPVILAPVFRNSAGTYFRMGINTGGLLTSTPVSSTPAGSVEYMRLFDENGHGWAIGILSNGLIGSSGNGVFPPVGSYTIGQLTPQGNYVFGIAAQPGGPPNPVTDPAQTTDEHTGDFYPGCSHSIRSWDVKFAAVEGIPSALVCCPICGYLQKIITPASDLYNESNSIIFA